MISTNPSVDGIGTAATFKHPSGIVIDGTEKYLYVTDSYDYSVRRITLSTSLVETITAHGGLSNPDGIAIDPANNNLLYVIEQGWGRIRKLDMTLYAGTPLAASSLPIIPPATFNFNHPVGVAIDAAGKIFVTNYDQVRAGSIPNPSKPVIAGSSTAGYLDAAVGTSAKFSSMSTGLALEPGGASVFVADQGNNVVRRVGTTPSYPVSTYAGHAPGHPIGCLDGTK
jgi:sugar lactone lactonase YvrE